MSDDLSDIDHKERRTAEHADGDPDAWQRMVEEMELLAEDRRDTGWRVLTITAGDTTPEPPEIGTRNRFGLVYIVPDNIESKLTTMLNDSNFEKYQFYRTDLQNRAFVLTELLDSDTNDAIFVAGSYDRGREQALVNAVKAEEAIYTHLQKLDGTVLMTVEHMDYSKFFPSL